MDKLERKSNQSGSCLNDDFTIDDGTRCIDVIRWVNDASNFNEMAAVQNGIYVTIIGSLKEFQGKRQLSAFSVRPVIDYNAIHNHFIQCIHVHLVNTRAKAGGAVDGDLDS